MLKTLLIVAAALTVLVVAGLVVFVYVIQNVEQPEYALIQRDGEFELRDYPALTVAQVQRSGARREALSAGFGPLARYIFAKERTGEKVAMTAPVIQQPDRDAGDTRHWTVGFIMPKAAVQAGLPDPGNDDVQLTELAPRQVAAVRFSGRTTDDRTKAQRERLQEWIAAQGLRTTSAPTYAYYNDPMTPGPLRRNEILYDIAAQ